MTVVSSYAERLRVRLEAVYQGDEARAQSELYGSPRQDVTLVGPDHPPGSDQPWTTDHPPTVKNDGASAGTGRAA